MRRPLVGVLLVLLFSAGAVVADAVTTSNAETRGVVLFVGDSNITLGSAAIDVTLTWGQHNDNGYVPVLASRAGSMIRTPDCLNSPTPCTTFDYWKLKLATIMPKVNADVIVNDLGINDTATSGTATTPGYAYYGQKIDWFMELVGGKPVLWTNLPCAIEPPARRDGCQTVNWSLSLAAQRWPNLTVLGWNLVANNHPEYMSSPGEGIHYSAAGRLAWSKLVVDSLDDRFPAP
jgi:hypothetical protein